MFLFTLIQHLFPGRPTWTADHLPDLSSKVAIVTGGNAGIGRETVKRLLLKNAKVYLAARSKERAERAIKELREETGKEALFLELDLGNLDSVKKAAEEFNLREPQLDVLYLNAGILWPSPEQVTAQGYDATFGTNVIGHFLLARLLYPVLKASGSESDPSRVIWLSSMGHFDAHALEYETYKDGPERRKADLFGLYRQSKLAAVLISNVMARSCIEDNIVSIAVDPGNIKSDIFRGTSPLFNRVWDFLFSYPTEYGALSSLYAGFMPEAANWNGKYVRPWARLGDPSPLATNVRAQDTLWAWLDEQVKSYL
ncbi:NAD-P-binding protein [Trametes maxima]|nr:NAD-P-binding protein [Trametes maxima]